jgi:hypothetical protein
VHAVSEVQDTPEKAANWPGLCVVWGVHVAPFQCAASVPVPPKPTAKHDEADVQDTALKLPDPPGLGVVWIVHAVPFQRSASVKIWPGGFALA